MAKNKGVEHLFIHPILDGRDTPPKSGINYLKQLEDFLAELKYGKIASIVGRYWAMDRDTRWDRVQRAFDLYTMGEGASSGSVQSAISQAYKAGQTDEFVEPVCLMDKTAHPSGRIDDQDAVVFFNFRADRAKEITRAFSQKDFTEFNRTKQVTLSHFVTMTQYDETFNLPSAFDPQHLENILGEVLSRHGISQLRIAETEKYAHVTYFFNGGDETVFDLEKRLLIPSPRDVATYDEKPEMSAVAVTDAVCEKIQSKEFQFILLNFANMDMVGHSGIIDAAVRACETVDTCVRRVVNAIWETGGTALITADHGNCEQMIEKDGTPHTAHTLNPVRLILAGHPFKNTPIKDGILGDIAPTILKIMGIDQPAEMTGVSLI
jgi:2,3-bisphosphoglycerate-independent phosphoglycerate mutase